MEEVALGRTGLKVHPVGFGAAEIGFLETDPAEASRLLNGLLDRGIRLLDTAAAYEGSEALIGSAVCHRRDDYVLVSKCGLAPDLSAAAWSAARIAEQVDRSLKRLKTDRIDVMLLHSCSLEMLRDGEAYGALLAARDAGKVRFAGYSGDNEAAAHAATLPGIDVIETSVNLCDQVNLELVLPRCREADLGVLAKRSIANAAWKDPADQPDLYANYAATYTGRLRKMGIRPADFGFGDAAWPELALRFTLSQPGVHTAIIGTTRSRHVEANIAAAEKGPLPAAAVDGIRAAFSRAERDDRARWLGQT